MGQTIVEKIISDHVGRRVEPGEIVVTPVDGAMASDTTAPLAITAFRNMGGKTLWNPDRCILVIDHAAPAPNSTVANLHMLMRDFAREQGCTLVEAGEGICHQVLVETQFARPGQIIIGADSHTCTYGAVGAMGVGVGSTDLAAVWLTGKTWLKVPMSERVVIDGRIPAGVQGKDLILAVLARIGIDGATYKSLEISGPALAELSLADRLTMANMAIEAGAKTGFVHGDGFSVSDVDLLSPDPDAAYDQTITMDVQRIPPMVSRPHSPDLAVSVEDEAGRPVNYAFIGTCVNGRLEDLHIAAKILKDARVHPGVRLVVAPASRRIFMEAVRDGTVEALTLAGATFIPSGCGPCVGTHNGVPGDGEVVISSGNRNFLGRMGNPKASIYLASAATVAASARAGQIADPRQFL
jgi:3-isopropylmalate/(R)-2-methylmalate dehydratase large subunit